MLPVSTEVYVLCPGVSRFLPVLPCLPVIPVFCHPGQRPLFARGAPGANARRQGPLVARRPDRNMYTSIAH
eukprot:4344302-Lingulodinium_polyedra.AAC.1